MRIVIPTYLLLGYLHYFVSHLLLYLFSVIPDLRVEGNNTNQGYGNKEQLKQHSLLR